VCLGFSIQPCPHPMGGGAFLVIFLNFGSCGRLSWLNCQAASFRAHVNIVSLLTYLLPKILGPPAHAHRATKFATLTHAREERVSHAPSQGVGPASTNILGFPTCVHTARETATKFCMVKTTCKKNFTGLITPRALPGQNCW